MKYVSPVKDIDYHLTSIKCALVREMLGGIEAHESHLMQTAIHDLVKMGLSEKDIEEKFQEKFKRNG